MPTIKNIGSDTRRKTKKKMRPQKNNYDATTVLWTRDKRQGCTASMFSYGGVQKPFIHK